MLFSLDLICGKLLFETKGQLQF